MAETNKPFEVLTVQQAAERVGLPAYTLRRWCRDGQLYHVRAGRKIFIPANRLIQFLSGAEGRADD
jgi:excisionase family DNA binding protein